MSSTRVATRIGLAQLRTQSDFDDASGNSRVACSAVDPLVINDAIATHIASHIAEDAEKDRGKE